MRWWWIVRKPEPSPEAVSAYDRANTAVDEVKAQGHVAEELNEDAKKTVEENHVMQMLMVAMGRRA